MHWTRRRIGVAGIAAVAMLATTGQAGAATARDPITTVFGTGVPGAGGTGPQTGLDGPRGVSLIQDTGITNFVQGPLVSDTGNDRIVSGISPPGLLSPSDEVYLDQYRGLPMISDTGHHRLVGIRIFFGDPYTIAGTGVPGFSGDGGPPAEAQLSSPGGLGQPPSWSSAPGAMFTSVYVADTGNNRVRQIGTTITTVVGDGVAGFGGDGGPATAAHLSGPLDVAVAFDANSLYIADTGNNRIRRVAPDGTITTIAGNGAAGFAGDGGPATQAQLNAPSGVTVDPGGNVYIADTGNHRVRMVAPDGTITTIAGSDTATEVGDGGPAANARLVSPWGVAADNRGNLYIADAGDHRVRKITNALPTVAITASTRQAAAPVEVRFDGSGSDPTGRIVSSSWQFDGGPYNEATGPTVARLYTTAGPHGATVTVTDESGAFSSASVQVMVDPAPVPDGLILSSAQITGRWQASRLVGGQLAIAGEVVRPADLHLQVLRNGRAVAQTTFAPAAGGPFLRVVPLGSRLLPGTYTLRLAQVGNRAAAPLPIREITTPLSAPPEGVASATALGRVGRRLVARFSLASLPRPGARLVVRWIAPGTRRPAAVHGVSARAVVHDGLRLPAEARRGVWRAELRWGSRLVATATRRVRA
jgi:PKD domain-containing protein/NHL repeat-containing protein